MSLTSGVRLGAYEIVALIGADGMGELCTDACIDDCRIAYWQIDWRIARCR
jgi:hypothetical protein